MVPHWTHSFGLRQRYVYDPFFSGGNTDVNYYFGANSTEVYVTGEPASGNITGKVAGYVLSPINTPLYQQTVVGTRKGCGFDSATTDSFDAANNTIHDLTTGAIAVLVPMYVNVVTTNFENVVGKAAYGANGWQMQFRTGLRWRVKGATTEKIVSATALSTGLCYGFGWRSISSNQIGIATSFQADVTDTDGTGTATNTTTFALGSVASLNAAGIYLGSTVIWTGAAAETVIAGHATTLPAWWSKIA